MADGTGAAGKWVEQGRKKTGRRRGEQKTRWRREWARGRTRGTDEKQAVARGEAEGEGGGGAKVAATSRRRETRGRAEVETGPVALLKPPQREESGPPAENRSESSQNEKGRTLIMFMSPGNEKLCSSNKFKECRREIWEDKNA